MRQYELTYLVSDNVSESEITKVTGKIGGYVDSEGGKVLKEESWGRRKLAYPILKQLFATYVTMSFELEPDKLHSLERDIRHENDIIRHITIVKKVGKEELVLTAKDIADTKEIEEVVGGEKSFEAVLGETEESKDLMAVRGDEEKNEVDTHGSLSQIDTDEEIKEPTKEKIETEKIEEIKEGPTKTEEIIEKPKATEKIEIKEPKKKVAVKKATKKTEPKVETVVEPKSEKITETKTVKKPIKKKAIKKDESTSDEADRLAKLNQELDDILGEDL